MTEHTPTPWKLREPAMIQGAPKEGEAYGELVVNYGGLAKPTTVGRANAAFIVRAVNSHEALTDVCDKEIRSLSGLWCGCRKPAKFSVASKVVSYMELDFCMRHAPKPACVQQEG